MRGVSPFLWQNSFYVLFSKFKSYESKIFVKKQNDLTDFINSIFLCLLANSAYA